MAGRRNGPRRSKPKKGLNRYDPNNPSYAAAHASKRPRAFPRGPFTIFGAMLRQQTT